MHRLICLALALIAGLALVACGAQPAQAPTAEPAAPAVTVGALTISDPWVRPANPDAPPTTPMPDATPMAMGNMEMPAAVTSAGYMVIANSGAEADNLVGASAAGDLVEVVELHTVIEEGGMMKMRPVERVEVPAGGEVALEPGSFHIMLIGVKQALAPGDTVRLTLTFEKAGAVEVDAAVRPMDRMP